MKTSNIFLGFGVLGNCSVSVPDSTLPIPFMESSCITLPPASDSQGWRKCKRIVGNNPCLVVVAVIISILVFSNTSIAVAGISKGKTAPDFSLRSMAGDNVRLSEMRGKVIMVNFWATWCAPCRKEMPLLDKLYKKHKQSGFVLFGVNIDNSQEKAEKMAKKLGVTFPVLFDTDKTVSEAYGVSAMPFTVILDKGGRVRHVHKGYLPGYEKKYDTQIGKLLGE